MRHYRDDAPEPLREQIDDFIFQESTHSREHIFFNRQARDAGYDMAPSEDRAARTIAWARRRPPIIQLAATCALEHFTWTLANAVLADRQIIDLMLAHVPKSSRRLQSGDLHAASPEVGVDLG